MINLFVRKRSSQPAEEIPHPEFDTNLLTPPSLVLCQDPLSQIPEPEGLV
jgi:hypothetical protein